MTRATSAPATPVSLPNRWGSEKTPAPTIDPTTMAVRVASVTFWAVCAVVSAISGTRRRSAVASRPR
jgi:hypothetical protein